MRCLILDASFIQMDIAGPRSPCGVDDVGAWVKIFSAIKKDCELFVSIPKVQSHIPGCSLRQELFKRLEMLRLQGILRDLIIRGKAEIAESEYEVNKYRELISLFKEQDIKEKDFQYIIHALSIKGKKCKEAYIVTCDNIFFDNNITTYLNMKGVRVLRPSELLQVL